MIHTTQVFKNTQLAYEPPYRVICYQQNCDFTATGQNEEEVRLKGQDHEQMSVQTNIPLKLVDEDGNVFFILARAKKALREAGSSDLWEPFQKEATSGNYDHLLQTCMKWFDVN